MTDLDELIELYTTHGAHHYDESVTQLDHGLQCAALARRDGASDALIAAALLHDVGHLLHLRDGGTGPAARDLHHEERGADLLATWFPPEVCEPVRLHVQAKRYLVAVEPGLHDVLSPGSQASLVRQGGPMSAEEVEGFERTPGHREAVALRRWDDAGKVEGLDVASFAEHEPLLRSLARA